MTSEKIIPRCIQVLGVSGWSVGCGIDFSAQKVYAFDQNVRMVLVIDTAPGDSDVPVRRSLVGKK